MQNGFFFFNDTATTEIYTLSLHDALPICPVLFVAAPPLFILTNSRCGSARAFYTAHFSLRQRPAFYTAHFLLRQRPTFYTARFSLRQRRSEEHTSELQSPCNLVCRLLLEKKKHIFCFNLPLFLIFFHRGR